MQKLTIIFNNNIYQFVLNKNVLEPIVNKKGIAHDRDHDYYDSTKLFVPSWVNNCYVWVGSLTSLAMLISGSWNCDAKVWKFDDISFLLCDIDFYLLTYCYCLLDIFRFRLMADVLNIINKKK